MERRVIVIVRLKDTVVTHGYFQTTFVSPRSREGTVVIRAVCHCYEGGKRARKGRRSALSSRMLMTLWRRRRKRKSEGKNRSLLVSQLFKEHVCKMKTATWTCRFRAKNLSFEFVRPSYDELSFRSDSETSWSTNEAQPISKKKWSKLSHRHSDQ